MPFTLSHPAIILPLGYKKNKYIDFSALVIGTMAPDFEYFIHFKPVQIVGHTLLGQLYFNLPIIIIMAWIYHYTLKDSIISNLPNPYSDRYYYMTKRLWSINSLPKLLLVSWSALLGSFTHLLWDSFTHENGFFVNKIRLLSKCINFLQYQIPIYKILQHGSTLLGFICILIYLYLIQDKKKNNTSNTYINVSTQTKIAYWSRVMLTSIIALLVALFIHRDFHIGSLIISFVNSVFIGLIIVSITYKIKSKHQ